MENKITQGVVNMMYSFMIIIRKKLNIDLKKVWFFSIAYRTLISILKIFGIREKDVAISVCEVDFISHVRPKDGIIDIILASGGVYEEEVMWYLKKTLGDNSVFIDVGANFGYHTVFAATLMGKRGRVISFEPLRYLQDRLYENLKLNNLSNVNVVPYALGNKTCDKDMFVNEENIGASSLIITDDKIEKIHMGRFDDMLGSLGISETLSVVLKIDVEGYELEVLRGMESFLSKHRVSIVFEYSPMIYNNYMKGSKTGDAIISLLESLGYSLYAIHGKSDSFNLAPILDFPEFNKKYKYGQVNLVAKK